MAVEDASSSAPTVTDGVLLPTTLLFSDSDFNEIALLTPTHAPPGDIPLYFTTQRFVI